uniref:Uncharacterized protein n=1 Tax=Chromera velia CCMP2878 TaxID=1169474 RepID=A0A0G4IDH7_9ALVE|eukprot:Cvel_13295.t1-p1 / transcript=Cvel_13295.t1 / gene=Cvel_13295 / organism=Chromera_velia_CCMP2878 / gene_product=hypothetical protein / transcript_product=hypothetical protein / location=Cvel_scaffold902:24447-25913(+) / protein_length=332 / sequence_SO=supercontig / SO=protein_coding / is_pseudo=false
MLFRFVRWYLHGPIHMERKIRAWIVEMGKVTADDGTPLLNTKATAIIENQLVHVFNGCLTAAENFDLHMKGQKARLRAKGPNGTVRFSKYELQVWKSGKGNSPLEGFHRIAQACFHGPTIGDRMGEGVLAMNAFQNNQRRADDREAECIRVGVDLALVERTREKHKKVFGDRGVYGETLAKISKEDTVEKETFGLAHGNKVLEEMMDEIEVEMEGGGGDLTDLIDALRFDLIAVERETDVLQEESVEFAEEFEFPLSSREGGVQYSNSPPKKKGGIAVNVCPSQSVNMRKRVLEIQNDLSSRPEGAAGATPERIFKVYRETFESYINRGLLL